MPKITVVTPTIRGLFALRPVEQSLKAQTFESFEWLIEIGDGKTHALNRDFNCMLRRARGELVVFAEDLEWFPPDGLQKFWDAYQSKPGYFFTAPVPKAPSYFEAHGQLHYRGPLEPEERSKPEHDVIWANYELDWAAAPLAGLIDIGGFDEALDEFWSNDSGNLAYRAELAGWKFHNVTDNPAVALKHDSLWVHPFRDRFNPDFAVKRLREFKAGLKLKFER